MSKINRVQLNRMQRDLKRALTTIEAWQAAAKVSPKPLRIPRGPNAITRAEVVCMIRQMGHPVNAEIVRLALAKRGKRPTANAIAVKLHNALSKGELVKLARGLFAAAPMPDAEAAQ